MNTVIKVARKVMSSRGFVKLAPHIIPTMDRAVHRLTGGRKMLLTMPRPEVGLILTTTGASSGLPRRTPLVCLREETTGTWLVVGSNFGKPNHPFWTANLRRHPEAVISWEGKDIPIRATQLDGAERELAWAAIVEFWPPYAAYQSRAGREIRLFRLEPRTPTAPES